MNNINVNFNDISGKIKPMHAVNNGPVHRLGDVEQKSSNLEDFKALGIPAVRNHDASFELCYGGEHSVDVHRIFPDFDKDPYDENSYDFDLTDDYMRIIQLSGADIFYRLGTNIEHLRKRYGTIPPKDFKKWAVICEHIIRHYNQGWANGFEMNITYWEIWNEPDGAPNWTGTPEQYYELYNITAAHLKKCFPNIKVGGPALAFIDGEDWLKGFFDSVKIQPDFFSWHIYTADPYYFKESVDYSRKLVDSYGWKDTELIINEWNYVKDFVDFEKWKYSLRTMINMKGAAFVSAVMNVCQYTDLDMLMYYDARPCGMNGLFSETFLEKRKGYYSLYMFNQLYKLGRCVGINCDNKNLYACAAVNESQNEAAIIVTHYDDSCDDGTVKFKINIDNFAGENGVELEYYIHDENNDIELFRTETFIYV